MLQEKPSIRQMEAKNGPYAVSASFSLTNKPVNALWEWSKVSSCCTDPTSCSSSHNALWQPRALCLLHSLNEQTYVFLN